MKKKVLALVLMMAMVLSLVACGSKSSNSNNNNNSNSNQNNQEQDNNTPDDTNPDEGNTPDEGNEDPGEDNTASTPTVGGQLIVGTSTQSNNASYPFFTTNATDSLIFNLTGGYTYNTVPTNESGQYIINPQVVADRNITENADGSKTVTYKLCEDLKWSNGDPITAKDYVFYLMFFASPELLELGASDNTAGLRLVGFSEYNKGESKVFSGVHLIGEYEFAMTINPEYLPYYYEDGITGIYPFYMKGWMPEDVDILDDGEGCYFNDAFTVEHVQEKVDSFNHDPDVFCGPYVVDNYDKTSDTYTMKINPEFKGDFNGQKPYIETIITKKVVTETQMDELTTGGVDFLLQIAEGPSIDKGLDMVESGGFEYVDYPRNGYGYVTFVCDRGPTQFTEVRHAIAYLLDRNEFARTFTSGYGTTTHASYGLAQWMVEEAEEEIGALNPYNKNLEAAIAELEAGGWVLDKDGNAYTSGLRYKKLDDGTLMPLIVKWGSSENNPVSDLLATMLVNGDDTAAAGMQIDQTIMSFSELMEYLYGQKEGDYNMYNLATNYGIVFDPENSYKIGASSNTNHIADEELAELAYTLAKVPSGDDDAYLEKWVKFQQKYNELLPQMPLYSNIYHDFYSDKLQGYEGIKSGVWTLSNQILYCWIAE